MALALAGIVIAGVGAHGATLECKNNRGDAARIRSALNSTRSGGKLTLMGNCNIGGTTLNLVRPVTIDGRAVINYTGSDYAIQYAGDNLTIDGLSFNGGGIHGTAPVSQGGWTITNNTFQNITSGANGILIDNEFVGATLGKKHNSIDNNHFINIWTNGYPNVPSGQAVGRGNCGLECIGGGSGFWLGGGGLDDTSISGNTCDKIGYNCIKGFFDEQYSTLPGWAFTGHNIVIKDNSITNDYRIGIEFQGVGRNGCKGSCDYNFNPSDGTIVSGNYWHAPALQYNVFAFSLVAGGTHAQYINNTAVDEVASPCYLGPSIGIENGQHDGSITQGNVVGSISSICTGVGGNHGWAVYITDSYGSGVHSYQNNIFCGAGQPKQGIQTNATVASIIDRYNYKSPNCPNDRGLTASRIVPTFTSPNGQLLSISATGLWKLSVLSNLSIRSVQFFVDDQKSPAATQVLQDINPNFSNDRKWLYHASIKTSGLNSGGHTITAVATDVSGATQRVTQSFSLSATK